MEEPLFKKIDTMLESVLEEVSDTDTDMAFKIRTARQLLIVVEEHYAAGQDAIKEADIDDETLESLRQLGYLNPDET